METQTQTQANADRPATVGDLRTFEQGFRDVLNKSVEKIVEDQQNLDDKINANTKRLDEQAKRINDIEEELGLDDMPWYKDWTFYAQVAGGTLLALGGGYLGGRLAGAGKKPESDASAQPVGEPASYDLD